MGLPPGYPYSETWRYCLFRHGEDKVVLEMFYRQVDTDSEDELSPAEAKKTKEPGKYKDSKKEEPQETREQGLKGISKCRGGAEKENNVQADAAEAANDAKTNELNKFPAATKVSTNGAVEECSSQQ